MVEILYIGLAGMIIILTAFILDLFEILHSKNKIYIVLNASGSLILAYYAYLLSSIPFFILNAIWAGAALIDFFIILLKKKRA